MVTKEKKEIFIRLLNEGIEVWRPTQALSLESGLFQILPTPNFNPKDEEWEFSPGSIVRCELKELSEGRVLVAVEQAT